MAEDGKEDAAFEAMLEKALEGTAVDQNAIDQLLNEEEKAMEESRREAQQRRKKNFVDYGPPYEYDDPSLAMDLISVCAHPKMKLRKLHFLLNERVDPNIPDPEDLYFTGLHWCARSLHFTAIRMLRRAGAKLDVTNELGQTPTMLCTLVGSLEKKKAQVKVATYFVKEGADLNIRDKAGYTVLDYAAMNQDFELLQLYIENGARCLRDNHIMAAKRKPLLKFITDPDCYRIVYKQIKIEQEEYDQHQAKLAEEKKAAAELARVRKLHQYMLDQRTARYEAERKKKADSQMKLILDQRVLKMANEEKVRNAQLAEQRHKFGAWRRETNGHWEWEVKSALELQRPSTVYVDARKSLIGIREQKKFDSFNSRWKSLTGKDIEATWTHSKPFDIEGLDDRKSGGVGADDAEHAADPLAFRDANDEELQGEDLDDMLGALKA